MLHVQQCTTYCTGSCRTTQQASGRQYRHRSGTESWCLGGFWRAAKSRGLPWLRDGDWRADWQREGAGTYLCSACFGGCLRACDQPGPALLQQPSASPPATGPQRGASTLIYPPYLSLPLSPSIFILYFIIINLSPFPSSITISPVLFFIHLRSSTCHSLDTLALVGHHEDYLRARSRHAGRRCYRQGPQAQAGQGASI